MVLRILAPTQCGLLVCQPGIKLHSPAVDALKVQNLKPLGHQASPQTPISNELSSAAAAGLQGKHTLRTAALNHKIGT